MFCLHHDVSPVIPSQLDSEVEQIRNSKSMEHYCTFHPKLSIQLFGHLEAVELLQSLIHG